jgi:hypothetical protein
LAQRSGEVSGQDLGHAVTETMAEVGEAQRYALQRYALGCFSSEGFRVSLSMVEHLDPNHTPPPRTDPNPTPTCADTSSGYRKPRSTAEQSSVTAPSSSWPTCKSVFLYLGIILVDFGHNQHHQTIKIGNMQRNPSAENSPHMHAYTAMRTMHACSHRCIFSPSSYVPRNRGTSSRM